MENLLLSSVSWRSNKGSVGCLRQVLDMGKHNIRRLAVVYIVLSSTNSGDMRSNVAVNNDVFFSGVLVYRDTAHYLESIAIVDVLVDVAKLGMKIRKGESVSVNMAKRNAKLCS